jgi:hypothetical protein
VNGTIPVLAVLADKPVGKKVREFIPTLYRFVAIGGSLAALISLVIIYIFDRAYGYEVMLTAIVVFLSLSGLVNFLITYNSSYDIRDVLRPGRSYLVIAATIIILLGAVMIEPIREFLRLSMLDINQMILIGIATAIYAFGFLSFGSFFESREETAE